MDDIQILYAHEREVIWIVHHEKMSSERIG